FIWKKVPCRVVLPTSSMSAVRTHFCTLVARSHGAGSSPNMYGMNCTIPAMVKRVEGSGEIKDADGTTVCPRSEKYYSQRRRISAERMNRPSVASHAVWVHDVWSLKVLLGIIGVESEFALPGQVGALPVPLRSARGVLGQHRLGDRLLVLGHGGSKFSR